MPQLKYFRILYTKFIIRPCDTLRSKFVLYWTWPDLAGTHNIFSHSGTVLGNPGQSDKERWSPSLNCLPCLVGLHNSPRQRSAGKADGPAAEGGFSPGSRSVIW